MKLYVDLKIDHLTLQERIKKNSEYRWICKCDCGKVITRAERYLKKKDTEHKDRITSCGCKNPLRKTGNKSIKWKGYGKVSGYYLAAIKARCKRKNIPCEVDVKYLWELYQKQNGQCVLSGWDIKLKYSNRTGEQQTASLDRIDSSKGYTKDNVQWVHNDINKAKNKFDQDEFIQMCTLVNNKAKKDMVCG